MEREQAPKSDANLKESLVTDDCLQSALYVCMM